jgi:4-amino-4-deoxy-L-arabinose transferase-like glycosyltransferase
LTWSAERVGLLLGACWLALALHGLGATDIVGDDEAREAGIVQDVVAGHWALPRFNAELLPDKPILFHWLAAVPCALGGFSETAVRLPSALAGAAVVGWTAAFAGRLFGVGVGAIAGLLLATTVTFFDHARVARPDVLLVALLAAALGAAFQWWRDGRRSDAVRALAWLGGATLAKGPVAPALFGTTVIGFLAWQRDLRRLPRLATAPGLAALVVLGGGWYAVALAGWGHAFVREHLVGRYLGNLAGSLVPGGHASRRSMASNLVFYPTHLLLAGLPWTPLALVAVWSRWREDRLRDPRVRFLVCWALAPVVVFTPTAWKLRYYVLPALPALACLGAPVAAGLLAASASREGRLQRGAVTLGVAAGALVATWAVVTHPGRLSAADQTLAATLRELLALPATGALVGFAIGAGTGAVASWGWRGAVGGVAAATALWMALGVPALEQRTSRRDSLRPLADAILARAPRPAAFFGPTVRPVVVYVGRPVPSLHRRADALVPGLLVVADEHDYGALVQRARLGPPLALAKGRSENLTARRLVLAEVPAP